MNTKPLRFAVIGNPVEHSLSPWIHQYFAEQAGISLVYEKILAETDNFEAVVKDFFHQGGTGLNITAPFKEQAFAMADKHTTRCSQAGSANTLWICPEYICADNTDGPGLIKDVSRYLQLSGASIAILGAGGAARGIIGSLLASKPETITVFNRTLSKAAMLQMQFPQIQIGTFSDVEKMVHEPFDLLIHATSAPMNNTILTMPDLLFNRNTFCYDLCYDLKNPTPFVTFAHTHQCRAVDGSGMLIEQAAEAFRIWHGVQLEVDVPLIRKKIGKYASMHVR